MGCDSPFAMGQASALQFFEFDIVVFLVVLVLAAYRGNFILSSPLNHYFKCSYVCEYGIFEMRKRRGTGVVALAPVVEAKRGSENEEKETRNKLVKRRGTRTVLCKIAGGVADEPNGGANPKGGQAPLAVVGNSQVLILHIT